MGMTLTGYSSDELKQALENYDISIYSYELKKAIPSDFAIDDEDDQVGNMFRERRNKTEPLSIVLKVNFPIANLNFEYKDKKEELLQILDENGNVLSGVASFDSWLCQEADCTNFRLTLTPNKDVHPGILLIKGQKSIRVLRYEKEPKVYFLKDIVDKEIEINGKKLTFSVFETAGEKHISMRFVDEPFKTSFEIVDKDGNSLRIKEVSARPAKDGFMETRTLVTDSFDDLQLHFKIINLDEEVILSIDCQINVQLENKQKTVVNEA